LVKIAVTVKLVPDTSVDKRIDPQTKRLVRDGEAVLNPFDEYAIEAALQIKEQRDDGSTVTIVTMGPAAQREVLRKALALGADDAVFVTADALAGSDVPGTAAVLAAALRPAGFDLILCGTQSTDAITGELPGMLAELLGIPGLTYVRKLAVEGAKIVAERETDTGYLEVEVDLPALVSVTKSINEPRYAALKGIMGAKKKEIRAPDLAALGIAGPVGSDGARTEVLALEAPPLRTKGRVVTAQDAREGAAAIFELLREKKFV
jgi:electron transfer flavoprotein beta subunit